MDWHRVGRLSGVLLASQLRSGRSQSDPKSLLGRPLFLFALDAAVFLALFGLVSAGLRALGNDATAVLAPYVVQLLVFEPLLAVGVVLVAGVMFEFTTTARFATSDAANWLPVSPPEYVAASALSVALIYSMPVGFLLGAGLPLALALGELPLYGLGAALSVLGLVEGGFLIEMLRSTTQRASGAFSGRKGKVALLARAAVFLVVILLLEVAINPVLLLPFLSALSSAGTVTSVVPLFWPSAALGALLQGAFGPMAAYLAGQVVFVAVVAWAAGYLRSRFWAPTPAEIRMEAHAYGGAHPGLALLGLDRAEAALVSKDLAGFVRRREMLPMIVTPVVLALLGFLQLGGPGNAFTGGVMVLWVAWVAGFFALMTSITALGQERRAVASLFAFPLSARSLFRAKLSEPMLLSPLLIGGMALAAVATGRLDPAQTAWTAILGLGTALVGTLMGLSVAARFSDFQERPRAQYVRPWAMATGILGGLALVFVIVLPAMVWIASADPWGWPTAGLGLLSLGLGGVATVGLFWAARAGFDRFLTELRL